MTYNNIVPGIFIERINRFTAICEIHGIHTLCHVKNTGRLSELLIPGTKIYLSRSENTARKTQYDLVAVYKNGSIINIDSYAPNLCFKEFLTSGRLIDNLTLIKPEAAFKNSRFDFYIESSKQKAFIEVKGVTLLKNNYALFPDAPTARGIKHITELCECKKSGFEAYIIFIIQTCGIKGFMPNRDRHKDFAEALKKAYDKGVKIFAFDCIVSEKSMAINQSVPCII